MSARVISDMHLNLKTTITQSTFHPVTLNLPAITLSSLVLAVAALVVVVAVVVAPEKSFASKLHDLTNLR